MRGNIRDAKFAKYGEFAKKWAAFSEMHILSSDKIALDLAGECAWIAANHAMKCNMGAKLVSTGHGYKVGELNKFSQQGILKGRYEHIGDIANSLHQNAYESDIPERELRKNIRKALDFTKDILAEDAAFA